LITHGREERNLEYKGDVNWKTKSVQAKLIKTIMAFSNIPDGGAIVLGVEQEGEIFTASGLSTNNYNSFKQDDVSDVVNGYADPYVELTVRQVLYDNSNFIVIQVKEFSEIPVICKKNGIEMLIRGGIYIRPRRKHETVIIPSQVEMRELIDSSIDKGIISLQKRLINLDTQSSASQKSDIEKFDAQIGDMNK
ncbi:MAG: ATP-binding protein, partial [Nitrosopumilus sp.]